MALTAQNVADAASMDMRQIVSSSGIADTPFMVTWIDRIQKDVLHSSFYNTLIQKLTTVSSIAGTSVYTLTPTDIRRILNVFNRTYNLIVLPIDTAFAPVSEAEGATPAPGQVNEQQVRPSVKSLTAYKTQALFPQFYRWHASNNAFYVFPAPLNTTNNSTLEVFYEQEVASIPTGTLATTLTVPEDGLDMMVAGVNWLMSSFLKREQEKVSWLQIYEKLKRGELIL